MMEINAGGWKNFHEKRSASKTTYIVVKESNFICFDDQISEF